MPGAARRQLTAEANRSKLVAPAGTNTMPVDVRAAEEAEIDSLARIWYEGWREAHVHLAPAELTRVRTLESFRDRLEAALPAIRVAGPVGGALGFCIVKDDELYQLFVTPQARGTGVAAALIADGEARLSALGVETAWLACAIGNDRAARFYEKSGWRRAGTMVNHLETTAGTFLLEVWRYEKRLAPAQSFILEPPPSPLPASRAFVRHARFRLRDDYLAKIRTALLELTDDQIWWRPNDASNSIGNLILHLSGNARQWIVAGVGGAHDTRDRAAEFARRAGIDRGALTALLETTLGEVDARLSDLDQTLIAAHSDGPLQRGCSPQGFDQTVLDAVFHVVEHFSYHTGQILLLAKWHVGERIRMYDEVRLNRGS
jgi:GNAT superfamily N-acetyltransferase/uncharacterized damage-inducible protein DinB